MIIEEKNYKFEFSDDVLEIYVEHEGNKRVLFDSRKVSDDLKTKAEQEEFINNHILPLFKQVNK